MVFENIKGTYISIEINEEGGEEQFDEREIFESKFEAAYLSWKQFFPRLGEIPVSQYDSDKLSQNWGVGSKNKSSAVKLIWT